MKPLPRIRFEFNERKATAAAAVMLRRSGGRMNYMKLIKLLYLAERESLKRYGRPICGDDYYSLPKGPVLSIILNLIKANREEEEWDGDDFWLRHVRRTNHDVELVSDPGSSVLSEAEIEILQEIHEKLKDIDPWRLVDLLHKKLPEWKDPGTSRIKIHPEDILQRVGKSPEEIEEIAQEIAEQNAVDALLREHTPA